MKKVIVLTLVVILSLVTGLFSGCNGQDKQQSGDLILEANYSLLNLESQKYADGRGFTSDNSRVMQWSERKGDSNQIWSFVLEGSNFFKIINLGTGLLLGSDENGESALQQRESNTDAQIWYLEKTDEENIYLIINKQSGMAIDNLGRTNDGSAVLLSEKSEDLSQRWFFERKFVFDSLASHYIEYEETGQVLSIENSSIEYGAKVIGENATDAFSQQWFLIPAGEDMYLIKNLFSSKVLNLDGASNIVVDQQTGSDSQKWEIIFLENSFRIVNAQNGEDLVLESSETLTRVNNEKETGGWNIRQVYENYAVPKPNPLDTGNIRIGTMTCNLWTGNHWNNLINFGYRTPVLGYYKEGTPKVTDWEIKIAVDNGISFFVPVWYRSRGNEGQPVIPSYDHWIKSLDEARYGDYIEYFIMWDLANESMSSFKDEDDLINNVFTYWMENYFKSDKYMKIDGRPIVAIFAPGQFMNILGGVGPTASALDKMNKIAIDEGFEGILFWGAHHWGNPFNNNELLEAVGIEYSFSYHWPTFASGALPAGKTFTDEEIIRGHQYCWDAQAQGKIPNILTTSMGWDSTPWGGFVTDKTWRLTPESYKTVLENAKNTMTAKPGDGLDTKIMLLDNWNEFGEGHYIFPTEYYGFGYVNAVRETFGIE